MSFESPLPPYNASDPTASFLNSSCLDLLMIEIVPLAWRVVRDVDGVSGPKAIEGKGMKGKKEEGSMIAGEGTRGEEEEQEERDAVYVRLDVLGYRVGQGLVERFVLLFLYLRFPVSALSRVVRFLQLLKTNADVK